MEAWIKALTTFLTGGLAVYWQPALETTQYSLTSALDMSGAGVVFMWLAFVFLWALAGAAGGHLGASIMFNFLNSRFRGNEDGPPQREEYR